MVSRFFLKIVFDRSTLLIEEANHSFAALPVILLDDDATSISWSIFQQ